MNGALLFLVRRSAVNGVRSRIARLRQPRYLVPTLIGLAYFVLVFGPMPWREGGRVPETGGLRDRAGGVLVEWGMAAGFLLMAALAWVLPSRGPPLHFLESEVEILFPGPLTRRELVRYKILDMQKGLLALMLLFSLFFGLQEGAVGVLRVLVGGMAVFNLLTLHQIGARFARQSLLDHGASGWRRQGPVLAVLAGLAAAVVAFAPPLPDLGGRETLERVVEWLEGLAATPAGWLLLPFRLPGLLFRSPDLATFLLRLLPVAVLAWLLYRWVLRADVAFEEAAAAHAVEFTRRVEAARKGRMASGADPGKPARRNPWRLAASGPPEVAFAWKSVGEVFRHVSPRLLILLVVIPLVILPMAADAAGKDGERLPLVAAVAMVGIAGLLVMGGPSLLGSSLRADLEVVETLKTLPLTGARLVRSSLAGSVFPTAVVQGALVAGAVLLVPATERLPVNAAWRIAALLSLLLVLPALTALSAGVDAAAALLFPAWVRPGQAHAHGGMEGMGYGIVSMLGKFLLLGLGGGVPLLLGALLPALAAGLRLPLLLPAAAIAGAMLAAGLVLLEVWLLCAFLGRRFEALDPAAEGMIA